MPAQTKFSNSARNKQSDGAHITFMEKKLSPIPPSIEHCRQIGKHKIITWGYDNLYPQWLNYLYYNNAMHGGIINGKVHFTVSGGLKYTPAAGDAQDLVNWQRMYDNGESDFNLDEVAEQISTDYELSNKYVLAGVWDVNFQFAERVWLIDFEKARKVEKSTDLLVCEDLKSVNKVGYKIFKKLDLSLKGSKPNPLKPRVREFYVAFEHRSKQYKDKQTSDLSKGCYPVPSYSGAIRSICTGIEIDEFQNAEIVNGFSLGTIINLNNGQPRNQADKDALEKKIRAAATGGTNAGGIWISYNNGKDRENTVAHITSNDLPARYIEVDKGTTKKIIQGHSVTVPILFGVKEEGSLGNATELKNGYIIMNANYFRNRRRAILKTINMIARKCNGLLGVIEFNEPALEISDDKAKEPTVMIQNGQFKKDEDKGADEKRLMRHLSAAGVSREGRNILFSKPVTDTQNINETDCIEEFKKTLFANLTTNQSQVLNLIGQGDDFNSIKNAMNINASVLARIYGDLIDNGFINADGGLTKAGATQVASSDISKMKILYSYEKRPEVSGPVLLNTSRVLCVELIKLDRLYLREEINKISDIEGYNVFDFAGGWWNDNGVNKPKCRHGWQQNVVFED